MPLHLFEGYGIELEYMIVDVETLDVKPLADEVLRAVAGEVVSEVVTGRLAWSNELVLHVIELKTNGPSPTLLGLAEAFRADVRRIDAILEPRGARLMPSGMHPWMDPERETRLWPHEHSPIYERYDAIFGCRGHGWSNLQSMHVNLPFAGDDEFGRLHAAIRLLLPILPALAASSPLVEGRPSGAHDTRLRFYRQNSAKIPSVTGLVVPERVFSRRAYEEELLGRIYRDVAPHDPEGVLRREFVNSRGAIARFDRSAIEIRVLDVQEEPLADLAIAALVSACLRALVEERWSSLEEQKGWAEEDLAAILWRCAESSDLAPIESPRYLETLGLKGGRTAGEVWARLAERAWSQDSPEAQVFRPAILHVLEHGTLARRILRALGDTPGRERVAQVYRRLCDCLHAGERFDG